MNTHDAIRTSMDLGQYVMKAYLADLSDADLLLRPGKGCNHLAWQLGHLVSSQASLLAGACPGVVVELPAGFAERHGKDNAHDDNPSHFGTKQQYVELFDKLHAATLSALAKLSDADLDQPAPEKMREHFPTVGTLFVLIAQHPMMHAGQFVVVRRMLGKPIVI